MGNEDLGSHFEAVGSLHEATEAYSRMRHDVSTMRHIIDCSRHLISVSLQRRDWAAVISNVGKITGVQGHDEEQNLQPYVKIATGIGHLGMENYRTAALSFLEADSKVLASVYDTIASPSDVAMYGGLLALATMDRGELQSRVLENSSFRTFLEHEAQLRKAINFFVNGRYSNCLSSLESIRADCLLDLYLQRHVDHLYLVIRSKCIMQYIVPFSCVKLETMEAAFSVQDQSLEDELVEMIKKGRLEARIDSEAQV
jgi:COP9 signalosome complex subunit 1